MSMKPVRRGFSLVELLIVIAIIAILVSLVVLVTGAMLKRAKSTQDMTNHKTISSANWSYSNDHKGMLLHPRTGLIEIGGQDELSTPSQIERFWIAAHGQDADGNNRLEQIGSENIEMLSSLRDGAAYPYIGDITVYQSPLDSTIDDILQYVPSNPNLPTGRIRSYSINAYVGVERGADDATSNGDSAPYNLEDLGYWRTTETASQISQPSGTMYSIGEQDWYGQNGQGWMIHPVDPFWGDFPAFWDEGRVNISYVDGSTGSIKLESDALEEAWSDDSNEGHDALVPTSVEDHKNFKRVLLPGVIGTILD